MRDMAGRDALLDAAGLFDARFAAHRRKAGGPIRAF